MTKIQKILSSKNMTQAELRKAIYNKYGVILLAPYVSRIITGQNVNLSSKTAYMIASTLDVLIDDIIEKEYLV